MDNGSRDGTVAIIEEIRCVVDSSIIPIYLDGNTGTTYSRNLALKRAKGKYICVVDSDVVLQKGTLAGLTCILDREPSAGLVAPRLVYPDGRWQKSTDDFPTLLTKIQRFFWLKKIEKRNSQEGDIDSFVSVDYAISALWVMRREILEKVGLLDEKIFYAPEDADYCLRIWLAGYKVLYAPQIWSVHDAQEISRGIGINKAILLHIQGLLYYFWKHRYFLQRPLRQPSDRQKVA